MESDCPLDFEFLHHRPEEAHELAGHRDHGDARGLPGCDAVEQRVEMMLRLPGMANDLGGLAALPCFQSSADGGSVTVVPRRLYEDVATTAVARFGYGTPAFSIAGGVLAGYQTQVGHELTRPLEATPIADLTQQRHGGDGVDAAEAP